MQYSMLENKNTKYLISKTKVVMKKIFIAIAAVAAISFSSCGNSTKTAETEDTLTADVVDEPIEKTLEEAIQNGDIDAIKAEFDKIKEMIANGDTAEAKKYAYKLQEFAAAHKDDLNDLANGEITVDELINGIKNMPSSVSSLATGAKDAATSDAKTVKEEVKEAAKEKANEEANKAVDKINEKTTNAVNSAADAAKKKLGF